MSFKQIHKFSFLGIENNEKENPEKCKNNFLLLLQYTFCSRMDVNTSFKSLIKPFKKYSKYFHYFESKANLKNLYLSAFKNTNG